MSVLVAGTDSVFAEVIKLKMCCSSSMAVSLSCRGSKSSHAWLLMCCRLSPLSACSCCSRSEPQIHAVCGL